MYKRTADTISDSNVDHQSTSEPEGAPVKMIVVDGIVMGPTHCAFDDCIADLDNSRGGAFCADHENEFGDKCRVLNCQNDKVHTTQACEQHQGQWKKHMQNSNRDNMAGVRRML